MAENTIYFPDLALDKFLGNDLDRDAKSFLQSKTKSISHSDRD